MNLERIVSSKAIWNQNPTEYKSSYTGALDTVKNGIAAAGIAIMAFAGIAPDAEARDRIAGERAKQAITQQLTASQEPEGVNSAVLGDHVENYRVEVFRKEFDAWQNHPGRTNNWKWGHMLVIADYGCGDVEHIAWNEKDLECPTGQNPPRALTVNNNFASCPPQVRANRDGDRTSFVEQAMDDDFIKIYNAPTGLEIDNLTQDSFVGVPGAQREEKMDRSYTVDLASRLGIDLSKLENVEVDQWQMRMLTKYVRSQNDPYTITVMTQAEDAAGNPLCDVIAVTSYVVRFNDASGNSIPATKGAPSTVHKTIAANLYLKEDRAERTFIDTSAHGNPEIYAGEPAFDAHGHLIFDYGQGSNLYKIDANNASTYMPFSKLNATWERLNPFNSGAKANLPPPPN